MPIIHAVVWVDHHRAQVLQLYADETRSPRVKSHFHYTRQQHTSTNAEDKFFGEICDTFAGVTDVLITGSAAAQSDFRKYVDKERAAASSRIIGWELVDFPSRGQLLTLAEERFSKDAPTAELTADAPNEG